MSILTKIKSKLKFYFLSYQYYGDFSNSKNAMLLYQDFCLVPQLKEHACTQGLKLIDDYVDTKKKSDTIFIFGSGESVNYLTKEQWDEIKKHNTMAFNYFFVHDFVPDYYAIELWPNKESHILFEKIVKEKYQSVDMFIQYRHAIWSNYDFKKYPYNEKMWVYVPYLLPAYSNKNLEQSLIYFNKQKGLSLQNIIHHKSQTDCVLSIVCALGYKNIVLVGVDLNGLPYFTSLQAYPSSIYKINLNYEKIDNIRQEFVDYAEVYFRWNNTVLVQVHNVVALYDYLSIINNTILRPHDISFYCGSSKSKLSEFLSVYFK